MPNSTTPLLGGVAAIWQKIGRDRFSPAPATRRFALIDTGVNPNHSLLPRLRHFRVHPPPRTRRVDCMDYCEAVDKPTLPPNPHGSHLAGIIAALPQRSPLLQGMVELQQEMLVFDIDTLAAAQAWRMHSALLAVECAIKLGAEVVNVSFASVDDDALFEQSQRVLALAEAAGTVLVFAAGNSPNLNLDTEPHWPASIDSPNSLVVCSHEMSEDRNARGAYGGGTSLGVPIPHCVCSTSNGRINCCGRASQDPQGRDLSLIDIVNGGVATSVAAAVVSGAVLAAWSDRRFVDYSAAEIVSLLKRNARGTIDPSNRRIVPRLSLGFLESR